MHGYLNCKMNVGTDTKQLLVNISSGPANKAKNIPFTGFSPRIVSKKFVTVYALHKKFKNILFSYLL